MYSKPIGVSILTNGNRRPYLERCIDRLLRHCYYRPLKIGILNNGSTDDTRVLFNHIVTGPKHHGVTWNWRDLDKDWGCAIGTNQACELVEDCEFQLHLESDFELLAPEESGEDRLWLRRAAEFMQSEEANYLYLRRMTGENEMMAHWWAQWMGKITDHKGSYLSCPSFWWSNNPALFRTKALYERGTLPLKVERDGPKGTPGWSRPELESKAPGQAWIHQWGLFVHDRLAQGDIFEKRICRRVGNGEAGCKYGFFKTGSDQDLFCCGCQENETFKDMSIHERRFRGFLEKL